MPQDFNSFHAVGVIEGKLDSVLEGQKESRENQSKFAEKAVELATQMRDLAAWQTRLVELEKRQQTLELDKAYVRGYIKAAASIGGIIGGVVGFAASWLVHK